MNSRQQWRRSLLESLAEVGDGGYVLFSGLCYSTIIIYSYVMLCYVMLCYIMLCYATLCYVRLGYVMSCHGGPYARWWSR